MKTRLTICNRKRRFAVAGDAHLAAATATITLRPYRCDRCRQFHLTSRTKAKRVPRPRPAEASSSAPNDSRSAP